MGVPFVQPRCAAFPELLAATGGGVLCEPDDAQDLSLTLEALLLGYAGRLLLVSHDSALVDRVATRRLSLDGRGGWRCS